MIDAGDFLKWCAVFNLMSGNNPPPPHYIPPGGAYTPNLEALEGISSVTLSHALYSGNTADAGGVIHVAIQAVVTADDTNDIMKLQISLPLPGSAAQAVATGFSLIKSADVGTPGAIGAGCLHALAASAAVQVDFEGSAADAAYVLNLAFLYEIQSA